MRLRRAAAARWLFLYVHTACVTCRMYSRRQNDRKTIFFLRSVGNISFEFIPVLKKQITGVPAC